MNRLNVTFAPINQRESSGGSRIRRASKSCDACRKSKLRCVPGDLESLSCSRCVREGNLCTFSPQKRRGKPPVQRPVSSEAQDLKYTAPSRQYYESSAKQAPDQVRNQSRDLALDALDKRLPDKSQAQDETQQPVPAPSQNSQRHARSSVLAAYIHNTSNALDLLTVASAERHGGQESSQNVTRHGTPISADPATDNAITHSPQLREQWNKFWPVKKGILTKSDAVEFLRFYFENLWPLRPIVPSYYAQIDRYDQLAVEEPVLTATLILISSRYYPLPDTHGAIRSERIHWRLWPWIQRYLQSAMWGSNCTRTIGTVVSMLLFIEWHCKAINTPSDFTEDLDVQPTNGEQSPSSRSDFKLVMEFSRKQRHTTLNVLEKLSVVSPAYRSDKVSWMMLGNAIALAHEGCYFDVEDNTHTARNEPHRQEWSRTVLVFIHLADEQLATRLGFEPLLSEKQKKIVHDNLANTFGAPLADAGLWESHLTLTIHVRKSRELLQNARKTHNWTLSSDFISALDNIKCGLKRWNQQKEYLTKDSSWLPKICLDLDYHFARMYSFAPALHILHSCGTSHNYAADGVTFSELLTLANESANASYKLLDLVVTVLEPSGKLKYLAVRQWLSIVAASLHLLKLTIADSEYLYCSPETNISLLRSTVHALATAMPDDVHIGRRFARYIGFVLNASLESRPSRNDEQSMQSRDALSPRNTQGGLYDYGAADQFSTIEADIADLFDFDIGSSLMGDFNFPPNDGFWIA